MPDAATPQAVYDQRLTDRVATKNVLESRRRLLGWARLAAAALVALSIWGGAEGWLHPGLIILPLALFVFLVYRHAQLDRSTTRARLAITFYERGIARLEHRWHGTGETGDRFLDPHHP